MKTRENLPRFRDLILPYIYEELDAFEGDPAAEYICLAYNATDDPIELPIGERFCQMVFETLNSDTIKDYSQRSGAGISYQKEFSTFREMLRTLVPWRRVEAEAETERTVINIGTPDGNTE